MKNKILTLICLALGYTASAQLVNDGGTITVQAGAKLYVESDITNNAGSTITNNGEIEVQGDFDNTNGTLTSSTASILRFSGADNTTVMAGTHTIGKVIMEKGTDKTITLLDPMTISDDVTFMGAGNKIIVNGGHVTIIKASQLTGAMPMSADDDEYFVTNGTGGVTVNGLDNNAHMIPVGFDENTYNPITITETGAASDITVRLQERAYEDGSNTTTPISSEVVDASWKVDGGNTLDVTVEWAASDELMNFDRTDAGVARWSGSSYDLLAVDLGAAVGSDPYTLTKSGTTPGVFVVGADRVMDFVAVSPKAFLGGTYDGTDHNDALRSMSLIPTADPYPNAPYSYTHVGRGDMSSDITAGQLADLGGNSIVDWMFLELRSDNTTVVATKSVFVQKDGDIVEPDGSPVKFRGVADGNYHVVLRHRNHLGVMTNSTQALTSAPMSLDFTNGSITTFGTNALATHFSGTKTLWGGDSNGNFTTSYIGGTNDKDDIAFALLFNLTSPIENTYSRSDINMNGRVSYIGGSNDPDAIALAMLFNLTPSITQQLP